MKIEQTERGFDIAEFEDYYNTNCSLQKSSLATKDCIWLGIRNANAKILVSDAKKLGLPVYRTKDNGEGTYGWTKFDIPEDVFITTRMHLTREQVKELLPILQCFVETGELTAPEQNDLTLKEK